MRTKYKSHKTILSSVFVALLYPTIVLAFGLDSISNADIEKHHEISIASQLFWPVVNFTITLLILSWIFKSFVSVNLINYRKQVVSDLAHSKALLEDAQNILTLNSARLNKLQLEISDILKEQTVVGHKLADSLKEANQKAIERMKREAQRQISEELTRAKQEVRIEMIAKAVSDAENILRARVTPEADLTFRNQALNRL